MSSFITTQLTYTTVIVPKYFKHNSIVYDKLLQEIKKINNGLLTFDIKVSDKCITDLVIRDNGKFKT
jgi:hypothetical protein